MSSKLGTTRPLAAGRRPAAVAVAGAAVAVALVAAAVATSGGRHVSRPDSAPGAIERRRERAHRIPIPAAVEFVRTYLSFLYGRSSAARVAPVTPALGWRLARGRAATTPAELLRHPVVRLLTITRTRGHAAVARAIVDDGGSPQYQLTFNLSFRTRRWLVTGVSGAGSGA
jgi:hypothetical protein